MIPDPQNRPENRIVTIRVEDCIQAEKIDLGNGHWLTAKDYHALLLDRDQWHAEKERLNAEKDELLKFLNMVSPSLLNTPKRNAAGESTLPVDQWIAIAWGDINSWLEERGIHEAQIEALRASLEDVRATLEWCTDELSRALGSPASVNAVDPVAGDSTS